MSMQMKKAILMLGAVLSLLVFVVGGTLAGVLYVLGHPYWAAASLLVVIAALGLMAIFFDKLRW